MREINSSSKSRFFGYNQLSKFQSKKEGKKVRPTPSDCFRSKLRRLKRSKLKPPFALGADFWDLNFNQAQSGSFPWNAFFGSSFGSLFGSFFGCNEGQKARDNKIVRLFYFYRLSPAFFRRFKPPLDQPKQLAVTYLKIKSLTRLASEKQGVGHEL
jgi:hypothetical protein